MLRKAPTVAGSALAVGLLALATLPASAGEPRPPVPSAPPTSSPARPAPEIAPGLLEAVSRDLGISTADARARIANEQRAIVLEKSLTKRLGRHYGGAWVTGSTSKLVVATTDRASAATITATGARAKVVKHSLAALRTVQAALDRAARTKAPADASVWGVDVPRNTVLVQATDAAAAREFVRRSGADPRLVRVVRSAERPRTYADLRGGDAFHINGTTRCSIGFAVTKNGRSGFVTAGHCGKAGDTTTGTDRTTQGTFRGSSFPGNDYAWVEAEPGWKATPYVKGSAGANVTVTGSEQVPVGSSVCRSGSTSGWHCGTVRQYATSVTYREGTVYGVTRSTVCAEPGDSGGSFVSGSQAQGMTSGGTGDCTVGGTTYYQPVSEPLRAYGLTLRTGS